MSGHSDFREWSAAYVLGSLDPSDRREFEAHLSSCDECRARVAEFAPIPGLLARVDPVENPSAPGEIADRAVGRVKSDWAEVHRSRLRWRWAAVAAALLVVGLTAALSVALQEDPGRAFPVESEVATIGRVVLISKAWGTEVEITLQDLPSDDRYMAWAVASDGDWEQVASWGPTPANRARVTGASSISTTDLESIVITAGADRRRVASATTNDDT